MEDWRRRSRRRIEGGGDMRGGRLEDEEQDVGDGP